MILCPYIDEWLLHVKFLLRSLIKKVKEKVKENDKIAGSVSNKRDKVSLALSKVPA